MGFSGVIDLLPTNATGARILLLAQSSEANPRLSSFIFISARRAILCPCIVALQRLLRDKCSSDIAPGRRIEINHLPKFGRGLSTKPAR
jgi:hypothetical protein